MGVYHNITVPSLFCDISFDTTPGVSGTVLSSAIVSDCISSLITSVLKNFEVPPVGLSGVVITFSLYIAPSPEPHNLNKKFFPAIVPGLSTLPSI